MNKVFLIGRLARDPELRFTPGSGIAVTSFSLAVDRKGQNEQKEADFIPIVCWRKLAELVANNLTKGRLIAVTGSIRVSSYQTKEGEKKYKTEVYADEVKFLDWPKDGNKQEDSHTSGGNSGFFPVDGDDDIPF